MNQKRETIIKFVLLGAVVATAVVHLLIIPRLLLAENTGRVLVYIVIGWIPYTLAFYAVGRLFTSPEELPNMRPADLGLALFSISVLISLGLDRWGFTPERVPAGHALQAIGVYIGLALLGWGIGRRSAAIERISRGDSN